MKLYSERAWLSDGWAERVLLEVDDTGSIAAISRDLTECPHDAEKLRGPVLPGMANLHSHAFQRAFAGYTEQRSAGDDNFWSWRQVMYDFVAKVTPEQAQTVAEQLYIEMLKAGYTAVGEFHYLHHDPDGNPYASLSEMSERILAAAAASGIAITHLPVLYVQGGFGVQPANAEQRRFVNDIDQFSTLLQKLFADYRREPNVRIGIAPHSLRAVTEQQLKDVLAVLDQLDSSAPVHIHIAEQTAEVDASLAWCGARPVAWLLDHFGPDERWCLVHATHMIDDELEQLATSGATAGLCPTTEANLGDGVFPADAFLERGGQFGIGSDSNVSVSPIEELRTLEYSQRFVHRRRAILAPAGGSVGAHLYAAAATGGANALGLRSGKIETGYRADLVVIDDQTPVLINKPGDTLLDAMVFAGNSNPVSDVLVAGKWVVRDGYHPREEPVFEAFKQVQNEVWS